MSWWEAVLLGAVQGGFMFIPVSSTSHLVLTQHALIRAGSELPPPESPEMILFDLVVHVGTLVSVAVVFRKSLGHFLRRLVDDLTPKPALVALDLAVPAPLEHVGGEVGGGPAPRGGEWAGADGPGAGPGRPGASADAFPAELAVRFGARPRPLRSRRRLHLRLALLGLLTVAVTGVIGLLMKESFERIFASPLALAGTLTVTGILLWWTDVLPPRRVGLRRIGPGLATIVGIGQALALMPGLSRSGTTIAFALFAGLRRRWAAEFSFFVAIPTILAASGVQALEVLRSAEPATVGLVPMTLGFIVAALVGIAALHLVLRLLYRARFRYFSYYVWTLAAAVAVVSLAGWI